MLYEKKIKQSDYERASQLLGKLFEVDSDITEDINKCIQRYGVEAFFEKLESFDFSEDIFQKLNAVRLVLFGMGEIETVSDNILQKLINQKLKT